MNKINEEGYTLVTKQDFSDSAVQATAKKNDQNLAIVEPDELEKIAKQQGDTSATNEDQLVQTSSSSSNVYETDAVIQPQDPETIKYLSNVKDPNTNKVSKPFTIDGKNYQMVRGIKPNREIVLGVLCLDDGGNQIHSVEHFEKNVAIPMRERFRNVTPIEEEKPAPNKEKEDFIDHLNLSDVGGFKHFFVDPKTGDVSAKFKTTDEMLKSGVQLKPNERYMNAKGLKHIRHSNYFKSNMDEAEGAGGVEGTEGTDMNKLKADVKRLVNLISTKFATAITKIDKPVEQVEFLNSIAEMIGVPYNKLGQLISSYKDISKTQKVAAKQAKQVAPTPTPQAATPQAVDQQAAAPVQATAPVQAESGKTVLARGKVTEHKIIKKDALLGSLGVKQAIIKVKKTNNEKK